MRRLLILIRPDTHRVNEIVADARANEISLHELLSNVFVAEAGPRGILEEPLRELLVGTAYVLASYTAARANGDHWQNLLGIYAESRVGEPGPHELYVLLRRLGGDAKVMGFADDLSAQGIAAKQLAPGVYVSQPSAAQALTFSAKLGALVEDLGDDAAVVRFGPYYSSIPIDVASPN